MDTNDIMERRIAGHIDILGGGATVQSARAGHVAAAALLTSIPVQLWRFCRS